MPQYIRFDDDGSVSFTRNTELEKLLPPGDKNVKRMTEITWDDQCQRYKVIFLTGPEKGTILTSYTYEQYVYYDSELSERFPGHPDTVFVDHVALFKTYEIAVAAELIIVEAMRRRGHDMHE
jgi:hypothetical protein